MSQSWSDLAAPTKLWRALRCEASDWWDDRPRRLTQWPGHLLWALTLPIFIGWTFASGPDGGGLDERMSR
jgi:hypothetical protein